MATSGRKRSHEARILKQFLSGIGHEFRAPSSVHEPDGWTEVDGQRIGLELTAYYADGRSKGGSPQRKAVTGWDTLWSIIDRRRRSCLGLKNVMGGVTLASGQGPTQKTRQQLADKVIQVSDLEWNNRDNQPALPGMQAEPVQTVFIEDRSTRGTQCYQELGTAHIHMDSQNFPDVAKHIQQIHLAKSSECWPEWWGQDMRPGSPTYNSCILKKLLQEKSEKIRNRATDTPEWLIILCDLKVDVCTDIFPKSPHDRQRNNLFFKDCGYDYSNCPIGQIWLMSEISGMSYRVYPFRKFG